jgi:hypothetical protein
MILKQVQTTYLTHESPYNTNENTEDRNIAYTSDITIPKIVKKNVSLDKMNITQTI